MRVDAKSGFFADAYSLGLVTAGYMICEDTATYLGNVSRPDWFLSYLWCDALCLECSPRQLHHPTPNPVKN